MRSTGALGSQPGETAAGSISTDLALEGHVSLASNGKGEGAISERLAADCRYSLIPGGVYSIDEVRAAIERDAVVAAHYASVNVGSLREEHAASERRVFVSYRVGDGVFWSREPVALDPGEVLLTDGHYEIRARCGNLVSDGADLRAELLSIGFPLALITANDEAESGSSSAEGGDSIGRPGSVAVGLPVGNGNLDGSTPAAPGGATGGGGIGGGGGGGIAGGGDSTGGPSSGGIGSDEVVGIDDGRSDDSDQDDTGIDDTGTDDTGTDDTDTDDTGTDDTGTDDTDTDDTGTDDSDFVLVDDKDVDGDRDTPVRVPEPSSLLLFAIGAGAAALTRRRSRKS